MEGPSSAWSVTSIISLSASGGLGSVAREGVGADDIAREGLRGKKDRLVLHHGRGLKVLNTFAQYAMDRSLGKPHTG